MSGEVNDVHPSEVDVHIWSMTAHTGAPPDQLGLFAQINKVKSHFPREVKGTSASSFTVYEIKLQKRGVALSRQLSRSDLSFGWRQYFQQGFYKRFLAEKTTLAQNKDKLEIVKEAFLSGPPNGYITVRYGSTLSASLLFFNGDLKGPLQKNEKYRIDESKIAFFGKLIDRISGRGSQRFPFLAYEGPLKLSGPIRESTPTFKIFVAFHQPAEMEYIWMWYDELGVYFLDAIEEISGFCEKCGAGAKLEIISKSGKCVLCHKMFGQKLAEEFDRAHIEGQEDMKQLVRLEKTKNSTEGRKAVNYINWKLLFFDRVRAHTLYSNKQISEEEYQSNIARIAQSLTRLEDTEGHETEA